MGILLFLIILIALIVFFLRKKSSSPNDTNVRFTVETRTHTKDSVNEYDTDHDSWEGGFWDASDPKKLKAHLQIDYKHGNGNLTTRCVSVREFDNELYGGIIMGYCELRDATRTFRFDRINNCIDLETGEVVQDIKQHLNDLYEKSPERSTDLLVTDYIDVLKVIYFVAKADGQYRKEEKDVISSYVRKLVRDERITNDMVDAVLKEINTPSLQAYKLAIGRVLKGGEVDPELLNTCCQEIVDTQKTVHPMEKEALDYLMKKLTLHQTQPNP
jgi:hypothetical protein